MRCKARARWRSWRKLTEADPGDLKYYWFRRARCAGVEGILARTGYTGEDGFEFYFPPASSEHVWNTLIGRGQSGRADSRGPRRAQHAAPGSRISRSTGTNWTKKPRCWKPTWAGLRNSKRGTSWAGTSSLRQRAEGTAKRLIGFEMIDRAPGARWLSGLGRWQESGQRHQRLPRAVFEEEYRNGLRAACGAQTWAGKSRLKSADDRRPRESSHCHSINVRSRSGEFTSPYCGVEPPRLYPEGSSENLTEVSVGRHAAQLLIAAA